MTLNPYPALFQNLTKTSSKPLVKMSKTCIFCACIFLFIISDFWSILFILDNWRLKGYFGGYLVADSWESEKVLVSLALQLVCAAVVAFNKIKVAYMAYVKALLSLPHTFDKKANSQINVFIGWYQWNQNCMSRQQCPYHIWVKIEF